jgi:hypothetical protein
MLKGMSDRKLFRTGLALLALCAALPALADTQFRARKMTRNDVPLGKGQCDIRLQVDNEVEVTVRGDMVMIHTLSGRDPRDDGSECNYPLPDRDLQGFNFQVIESRNDIRLMAEPSRRNNFTALVHIRDSGGGEGRYHFRLSWMIGGGGPPDDRRGGGPPEGRRGFNAPPIPPPDDRRGYGGPPPDDRRGYGVPPPDDRRGGGGPGFTWNNTIDYRGQGRGTSVLNNLEQRLFDVTVNIDRGGRVLVSFRSEGGRPVSFTGTVIASEGGRLKADVVSQDRRLRGPMYISVDRSQNVNSITLEATDGRDRLSVNWDRR